MHEPLLLVHFKKGHYLWSKNPFKLSPPNENGAELHKLQNFLQNGHFTNTKSNKIYSINLKFYKGKWWLKNTKVNSKHEVYKIMTLV